MLQRRQPDLTVCLEMVHKPHNLAAIVRTADAVGVSEVHAVWPDEVSRFSRGTAAGSHSWVDVHRHPSLSEAISAMRDKGMKIFATNLSDSALDYRELDYTQPTAFLLGQEKQGISEEALEMADQHVLIPMVGMVQSLNVSVANSLLLYEAMRQREAAGMYQGPSKISKEDQNRIYFEGGHPLFARVCKQKELAYPTLDEKGGIVADDDWWRQIQMTQKAWKHLDD